MRRQIWAKNPEVYGDDLARILVLFSGTLFDKNGGNPESCELMREAVEKAISEDLKQVAREFLNKNCK